MKGKIGTSTQINQLSTKELEDFKKGWVDRQKAMERRYKKRSEPGLKDISKPGLPILVKKPS